MKLFCSPLDPTGTAAAGTDISVALYRRADRSDVVSIGATILQRLSRRKFAIAPRAWDLLSVALSIIAADTSVRRSSSPDGWTRQLDLCVAVNDPDFWSSQKSLLESQLRFLTTDIWSLEFVDGGILPVPPKMKAVKPEQDCVCLLSGGLDSLIGAVNLATDSTRKPYLVSQVAKG